MTNIEKRARVLKFSLDLEHIASEIAAFLLDIADTKSSISFGNRSSALSFNQKLNLLTDNQTITKEEKYKLELFGSIRNQFMHNIDANNYTDAFNLIDGAENKSKRFYPQFFEASDLEIALEKVVEQLYKEGLIILAAFNGGAGRKIKLTSQARIYQNYYEKLNSSVMENFKELEEALNETDSESIDKGALLLTITQMKFDIMRSPFLEMLNKNNETEGSNTNWSS